MSRSEQVKVAASLAGSTLLKSSRWFEVVCRTDQCSVAAWCDSVGVSGSESSNSMSLSKHFKTYVLHEIWLCWCLLFCLSWDADIFLKCRDSLSFTGFCIKCYTTPQNMRSTNKKSNKCNTHTHDMSNQQSYVCTYSTRRQRTTHAHPDTKGNHEQHLLLSVSAS